MQRIAYRLTSMLYDGIVTNSHAGAEFARRLHRLPQDKARVVWNGIDLQEVDARLASSRQPAGQIFPGSDLKRLCMVQPGKDYPLALRVVLEVMACGTPVVTTDYSDVRRILPFSEQVVSSRAAPEIAGAVVRCYRRRAELAETQRRWAEQHATASASVAALLAVYANYAGSLRRVRRERQPAGM